MNPAYSAAKEELLVHLRNQTGDHEADHGEAEKLLLAWLWEFEPEVGRAWEHASKDWWYA